MQLYDSSDDDCGDRWSAGELDLDAFDERAAPIVNMPPAQVIETTVTRSQHINWFARTYEFFKQQHLPQAMVTVNPGFFSDVIVLKHNLDRYCDPIIVSYEHGTNDKGILCQKAVDALGCPASDALLIDNKKATDRWQAYGRHGCFYRSDERFAQDVANGIDLANALSTFPTASANPQSRFRISATTVPPSKPTSKLTAQTLWQVD